ncbi:hypothetical protein RCL_jg3739.t1 [Rhizophagus clarus]|uniref:Uncharacterized protein n=1 Tax=Rhizophagus clarus TaxID=94130 RepID=A0A8H3LF88_9GLOM|nr:hypothetical protein RCL_jg3739.t1 [Rhizophagus clarus]
MFNVTGRNDDENDDVDDKRKDSENNDDDDDDDLDGRCLDAGVGTGIGTDENINSEDSEGTVDGLGAIK